MSVPVLAIVGYSNAGKTTLMEGLIAALKAEGLRIAAIKHAHHQPQMDTPGKDSWRHKQAGASASLLVGPRQMMLVADLDAHPSPRQLADMFFADHDLVLAEGFASVPGPKLEVVRAVHSPERRCHGSDLLAVVTDRSEAESAVPALPLNDMAAVAAFVLAWLEGHGDD